MGEDGSEKTHLEAAFREITGSTTDLIDATEVLIRSENVMRAVVDVHQVAAGE